MPTITLFCPCCRRAHVRERLEWAPNQVAAIVCCDAVWDVTIQRGPFYTVMHYDKVKSLPLVTVRQSKENRT